MAALAAVVVATRESPPPPRPDIPLDAWVPYWALDAAVPDAELRAPSMREVSPFWFNAVGVEEIVVDPNASPDLTARFIELASEINTGMPIYVATLVQDALNEHQKSLKGSQILVLGAAYKPDIDDIRESPALDVIGLLSQKGAQVSYHDPYIPDLNHENMQMASVPDLFAAIRQADCVVIITNHSVYDYDAILEAADLIVDTRHALGNRGRNHPKVVTL